LKNTILFLGFSTVLLFTVNAQTWVVRGPNDFSQLSTEYASWTTLAFNSSGTPYVAYSDYSKTSKVTVKMFNGSSWQTVGAAGISLGSAHYTTLAIDSSGIPYVAFQDEDDMGKIKVMKYDGNSWVNTGVVSSGSSYYTSLAISSSGDPYVAYSDWSIGGGKAMVKKKWK
jgi:hypothetical protein